MLPPPSGRLPMPERIRTLLRPRTEESLPDCAAPELLAEGPEGQTEIQPSIHSSSRAFWSGNASTWRGRHKRGLHRARCHLCPHRLGILSYSLNLCSAPTLCPALCWLMPGKQQRPRLSWVLPSGGSQHFNRLTDQRVRGCDEGSRVTGAGRTMPTGLWSQDS